MKKPTLRQYKSEDEEQIREICADTGFLGNPIDEIFTDRELFTGLVLDPFLKTKPEHAVIAEDNNRVVGYLIGTGDPYFGLKTINQTITNLSKLITRRIKGDYSHHPRSEEYIKWFFTRGFFEMPKHPRDLGIFHLNLLKGYRGIGPAMIEIFDEELKKENAKGYYGRLLKAKNKTIRAFERHGFTIYDQVETSIFEPEISKEDLTKICLYKRFN